MRITILQGAFLPVPPLRGGAVEKAWWALARAFAASGHDVTHVSRLCDGLPAQESRDAVRMLRVRGHDQPASLTRLKLLDLAYTLRARSVLPPADVTVTHTFFAPLLAPARSGRIYVHVGRFPRGQVRWYRRAAALQGPSAAVAAALHARLGGNDRRVRTLPYPLEDADFAHAPASGRDPVVLFAGRLHPEKGLDHLAAAWRLASPSLPGWRLRLVGPAATGGGGGGEAFVAGIRQAAGDAPLDITGPLHDAGALRAEYARASLFAYPSVAGGETFGRAVAEAMAAGCPPLVSHLACFRDLVTDGIDGSVVDLSIPSEAPRSLADRLLHLCRVPRRLAALGAAATTSAGRFRLAGVAGAFLADFHELTRPR